MHQVYIVAASIGGGILLIQLVLMMIGADGDADVTDFELDEAGIGGSEFFDYLSLKSVFSFMAFFGLAGLAVESSDWRPFPGVDVVVAIFAGSLAFYIVGLIMISFRRLESSGNLDLGRAVDLSAQVYLRIPGQNQGAGKVTVTIQGRQVEARAVTPGSEISTGRQVQVVRYLKPDTLEVMAL